MLSSLIGSKLGCVSPWSAQKVTTTSAEPSCCAEKNNADEKSVSSFRKRTRRKRGAEGIPQYASSGRRCCQRSLRFTVPSVKRGCSHVVPTTGLIEPAFAPSALVNGSTTSFGTSIAPNSRAHLRGHCSGTRYASKPSGSGSVQPSSTLFPQAAWMNASVAGRFRKSVSYERLCGPAHCRVGG